MEALIRELEDRIHDLRKDILMNEIADEALPKKVSNKRLRLQNESRDLHANLKATRIALGALYRSI